MFKEKITRGQMDRWTHDRQQAMTQAHWPTASGNNNRLWKHLNRLQLKYTLMFIGILTGLKNKIS